MSSTLCILARLFSQMTANFVKLVFQKSVRYAIIYVEPFSLEMLWINHHHYHNNDNYKLLYSCERALTLISFKNIQLKWNLMPSAFSQPIYPNLPSNVTDIFSTGENKGFHFSFCEGNLKNCKLKVSFLIRRIIIHVSSLLFVHLLLFFSK